MTLYGYAREPDSTDAEGEPPPQVPHQRAASTPVAVPAPEQPQIADPFGLAAPAPDLWAPPPFVDSARAVESPVADPYDHGYDGNPTATDAAGGGARASRGADPATDATSDADLAARDFVAPADFVPPPQFAPFGDPRLGTPALDAPLDAPLATDPPRFGPPLSESELSGVGRTPDLYTRGSTPPGGTAALGSHDDVPPPDPYETGGLGSTVPGGSPMPDGSPTPTGFAVLRRHAAAQSPTDAADPDAYSLSRARMPDLAPPAVRTPHVEPAEPDELPVGQTDHAWLAAVVDEDDDDGIVPWDRRPLMVAIAGAVALIVLAVLSGVATAKIFGGDEPPAAWRGVPNLAGTPTAAPGANVGGNATITLSGVGDVIMGTEPTDLPPNGGLGFFDPVRSALAADVVMGNLETPLTTATGKVKCTPPTATPTKPTPTGSKAPAGCFQFFLPPSYATHLHDGGFTVMNLANNHTNDMGPEGLANTRKALEDAKVQHTGAPNEITYVQVKGLKVAVLGFSVYSWGQNLNNIPAATELVRKADAEADIVVIQMQGGAEGADKTHVKPGKELYLGEDRGDLMKFSHAVIDAGADVVFGHGPHVMRGMEFYKGRLIAYSLGNFAGYGVLSATGNLGIGGVLKVTLNRDGSWANGQLLATQLVKNGLPAPDPEKRALTLVGGLSKEDFPKTAATISRDDGAILPPTP